MTFPEFLHKGIITHFCLPNRGMWCEIESNGTNAEFFPCCGPS